MDNLRAKVKLFICISCLSLCECNKNSISGLKIEKATPFEYCSEYNGRFYDAYSVFTILNGSDKGVYLPITKDSILFTSSLVRYFYLGKYIATSQSNNETDFTIKKVPSCTICTTRNYFYNIIHPQTFDSLEIDIKITFYEMENEKNSFKMNYSKELLLQYSQDSNRKVRLHQTTWPY